MTKYYMSWNRFLGKIIKYSSKEQAELQGIENVEEIDAETWYDAKLKYMEKYIAKQEEE